MDTNDLDKIASFISNKIKNNNINTINSSNTKYRICYR